jgi:hypothetical protein
VEEVAGLIAEPKSAADWLRHILNLASEWGQKGLGDTTLAAERVGMTAHHLFLPKQTQGVFLRISDISDGSLPQAYRDLKKQKEPETGESGEGVIREAEIIISSHSEPQEEK